MIRQIVIEAEPADDSQGVFCLSINADVIARGVTAAQAYYLVGEVLRRIGFPEHAETVTVDADGGGRESVRYPRPRLKFWRVPPRRRAAPWHSIDAGPTR